MVAVQSEPIRCRASARAPGARGSALVQRPAARNDADVAHGQLAAVPAESPAIVPAPAGVEEPSDWDRGLDLLLTFFGAALLMVVAVVIVGAVDAWWVLMPVMLAHLAVTFGVLAMMVHLLGNPR